MTATVQTTAHAAQALSSIGMRASCACEFIPMLVDGRAFFAQLRIDDHEHERRVAHELGAVTSTGALHALWSLPASLSIVVDDLAARDVATLRHTASGHIDFDGCYLRRLYQPAGEIVAIVTADGSLSRAVRQAAAQPAVYRRVAVGSTGDLDARARAAIERFGVGAVSVEDGAATVLHQPRAAALGRPAVFRWWLVELAYRNWLHAQCAHWTSCRFGSITDDSLPVMPS